jgi:4-amino-4-deoxy-L-arabinose transferase-like glycosyltransferase
MTDADAAPAPAPQRSSLFQSWRGPLLAAVVALLAGLPGVFGLPPLDRDESRYAQATAQMLETGDFVSINFQDQPRHKKPVGIHWMQAAAVGAVSSVEARDIRPYRIPSLLGAMLAAAACAWGASAFFGARGGFIAGTILAVTFLLSSEASIAKTDAVLCGAVVLMQSALARIYGAARGVGAAGRLTGALMWTGLALSILVKGPIGPMVFGLTVLALWALDRDGRWIRKLDWFGGVLLVALVVGPWAVAITVQTDGEFWGAAIGGDLAPKLVGGSERHGGLPGFHILSAPVMFFPAALLLPAALVAGWTRRTEPGIRFALAWLIPAWIVFELAPTKLVHYPLPLYGALAWLAAAALGGPLGPRVRWAGVALAAVSGLTVAGGVIYFFSRFGENEDVWPAALAAALAVAAGLAGAAALLRRSPTLGLAAAATLGLLCHGVIAGLLIPRLEPLLLSPRTVQALEAERLDPRHGLTPGPVEVAGYAEPSLVFLLGTGTGLGDAADAAQAIAEGRPAVVLNTEVPAFRDALSERAVAALPVTAVVGFNYSNGQDTGLIIFRPARPRAVQQGAAP